MVSSLSQLLLPLIEPLFQRTVVVSGEASSRLAITSYLVPLRGTTVQLHHHIFAWRSAHMPSSGSMFSPVRLIMA